MVTQRDAEARQIPPVHEEEPRFVYRSRPVRAGERIGSDYVVLSAIPPWAKVTDGLSRRAARLRNGGRRDERAKQDQ